MGKISKIRLQKESEEWQHKGLIEEELIFLCGPGTPVKSSTKRPPRKSESTSPLLTPSRK